MHCCITELRNKDVINKKSGCRLGNVVDCQVDTCTGCVVALVVCGRGKGFGLFPRDEIFVLWQDIEVIGDDIILVNCAHVGPMPPRRKGGGMEGLFR